MLSLKRNPGSPNSLALYRPARDLPQAPLDTTDPDLVGGGVTHPTPVTTPSRRPRDSLLWPPRDVAAPVGKIWELSTKPRSPVSITTARGRRNEPDNLSRPTGGSRSGDVSSRGAPTPLTRPHSLRTRRGHGCDVGDDRWRGLVALWRRCEASPKPCPSLLQSTDTRRTAGLLVARVSVTSIDNNATALDAPCAR